MSLDLEAARSFLAALTGDGGAAVVWQSFDDSKKKRKHLARVLNGTLDEHAAELAVLNSKGAGIFVTVNATDGGGRQASNVTALRAIFVDADDTVLPPLALAPSFTVHSARGPHAYWLLAPGEPLERFTDAQTQLARALGTDPTVKDLSRVMRVPGFWHRKGEPLLVTFEPGTGRRHTIAEVLTAYPAPELPKPSPAPPPRPSPRTTSTLTRARAYLAKVDPAIEGSGGDAQTLNAACRVVRGFDLADGDALELLLEWNARCSPPWAVEEIELKIRNARRYGTEPIGGLLNAPPPARTKREPETPPTRDAPPPEDDTGSSVLDRGSEIEIAGRFLSKLRAGGGEVIATNAALHQYNEANGAWEELPSEPLLGLIQHYDGAPVKYTPPNGKETTRPLKMNTRMVDGIYRAAQRDYDTCRTGFFGEAKPGVLVKNGFAVVDGGGVRLETFCPDHRARFPLPFVYSDDVDARPWVDFMRRLFVADTDCEQKISTLQEFVGACLIGVAPQYARCAVLTGGGANGKSTFLELVSALFPPSAVTSIAPHHWAREYYVARLAGSALNACNEIPEHDILAGETFKAVITGEPVMARDPYERPYKLTPRAGHLFACNSLPGTTDQTHGFWRRFLVIEFTRDFSKGGDMQTKEEVITEMTAHLPGALAWALHGAARLMRNGKYTLPASHERALRCWQVDSNSVAAWMDDSRLEKAVNGDPWMQARAAYGQYAQWCRDGGMHPVSRINFTRRLAQIGIFRADRRDGRYYAIKTVEEN